MKKVRSHVNGYFAQAFSPPKLEIDRLHSDSKPPLKVLHKKRWEVV